ncbi:MAG: HD domain-containing protein [Cytophagales bacterium]|nr:HD domain-containing protein [Cytophagales bacterium]
MDAPYLIQQAADYARRRLSGLEAGHDWWHVYRVWQNAKAIVASEPGANKLVVELGALFHDIADSKFHRGDESLAPRLTRACLSEWGCPDQVLDQVVFIVENVSFRGASVPLVAGPLELQIVRDADRLDALGAIGIARAFSFGGYRQRPFYDPELPPRPGMTSEEYKQRSGPTINHFYEKLLLLHDQMHTPTARALAARRHEFLELFLEEFYAEWEGRA